MNKKIVLTGGGTAGHVTPNIALMPALKERGFDLHYIGSYEGIERSLINQCGIPYYPVSSGKMRRYKSFKNFTDIFRILKGFFDSVKHLRKIQPAAVFSKGGYVVVPVTFAARILGIPVVIHESDITPGLANRLIIPFAEKICVSFPETLNYLPKDKGVITGTPIRAELWEGSKEKGLEICGFDKLTPKPVVLATGGSQGSVAINKQIISTLPKLLEKFHVIHLCGDGNVRDSLRDGYAPFEYAKDDLPHLLAAADVVVSRAGANTIFELLALAKPNILIPLPKHASRGDQLLNAESFENQGFSMLINEDDLEDNMLYERITELYDNRELYVNKMKASNKGNGVDAVVSAIVGAL